MARRRNTKKDDETLVDVVEVKETAQDFIDKNQSKILLGLLAFVLIVGGIFAYQNLFKAPKQAEAVQQMYQAQFQFERDSFALALSNPGGGYDGFLGIIENYGGSNAGNLAQYYAGICYLNLGQYDEAISHMNSFSPEGEVTPIMKNGVLGDLYGEKNDLDQAMSYYQKAVSAGNNEMLTAYYLEKIGQLHYKNGNFQEAKNAFQRIKEEFPQSAVGRNVDKYLTRVDSKI